MRLWNKSLEVTTAYLIELYDGILFKKPIIASEGTYLGDVVDEYGLGIVININKPTKNIIEKFDKYINNLME